MPERDWKLFLQDTMACIERIGLYTAGLDRKDFFTDQKTMDAVMRNLEVIGAAAKKLPENIKEKYPNVAWRKLAGLRDILIHHYFGIDEDIIWDVLANKIPEVKIELGKIFLNLKKN
jgi:uncharacterized protein with HEPN domain